MALLSLLPKPSASGRLKGLEIHFFFNLLETIYFARSVSQFSLWEFALLETSTKKCLNTLVVNDFQRRLLASSATILEKAKFAERAPQGSQLGSLLIYHCLMVEEGGGEKDSEKEKAKDKERKKKKKKKEEKKIRMKKKNFFNSDKRQNR